MQKNGHNQIHLLVKARLRVEAYATIFSISGMAMCSMKWCNRLVGGAKMRGDISRDTGENGYAEEAHLKARVIWYYFIGGLTQQQIATEFKLTRWRVNKILGTARADGAVKINITLPLASCVELEDRLKERYGLRQAKVIPSLETAEDIRKTLGIAAVEDIEEFLKEGIGIGVGWGRSLASTISNIRPQHHARSWVCSLMGGLTKGTGTSTFEVATSMARVLSAECYYVAAPIYMPTSESRNILMRHEGVSEAIRRAQLVDMALVSCGDMSEDSQIASTQSVRDNLSSLLEAGAVGDLLGIFLDAEGKQIEHPLNSRAMALPLAALKGIPMTTLVSGGTTKATIIRAILNGGYVKGLVTDEDCARRVLAP